MAGCCWEEYKPTLAMAGLQFIYAGVALLGKAALSEGMNPRVYVAYRQGIAALAFAPATCFSLRNKNQAALGRKGFCFCWHNHQPEFLLPGTASGFLIDDHGHDKPDPCDYVSDGSAFGIRESKHQEPQKHSQDSRNCSMCWGCNHHGIAQGPEASPSLHGINTDTKSPFPPSGGGLNDGLPFPLWELLLLVRSAYSSAWWVLLLSWLVCISCCGAKVEEVNAKRERSEDLPMGTVAVDDTARGCRTRLEEPLLAEKLHDIEGGRRSSECED